MSSSRRTTPRPALLQPFLWETGIAASFLTEDDVLARIDYPSYFDLTDQPLPHNRRGIVERLSHDRIIVPDVGGRWNITHLGAILFANGSTISIRASPARPYASLRTTGRAGRTR